MVGFKQNMAMDIAEPSWSMIYQRWISHNLHVNVYHGGQCHGGFFSVMYLQQIGIQTHNIWDEHPQEW